MTEGGNLRFAGCGFLEATLSRLLPRSFISLCLLASAVIIASGCARSSDPHGQNDDKMVSTVYYKPIIAGNQHCKASELKDVIDTKGKRLVSLCHSDFKNCLMQGSCLIKEGANPFSINYIKMVEEQPRFAIINNENCPYGVGVKNSCLDPFFTVAADLSIYKLGDVIFVPALVGIELPGNRVHDGYLIVRDTGGVIDGENRFDFFTGYYNYTDADNPFRSVKISDPTTGLAFQRVDGDLAEVVRKARNYPGLPKSVIAEGQLFLSKQKR